jgi:hypothetical protein
VASPDINERVEDALRRVLTVPEGRLALLWALNLRIDVKYDAINAPFTGDAACHAYNEGYRRAGQDQLDYLRTHLHDGYQALMAHLLDTQNQEHLLDVQGTEPLQEEQ